MLIILAMHRTLLSNMLSWPFFSETLIAMRPDSINNGRAHTSGQKVLKRRGECSELSMDGYAKSPRFLHVSKGSEM